MLPCIGVRTEDIEEARRWVEEALATKGAEREHVDMGGQYFRFQLGDGEFNLVNNLDVYDHQPFSPPEFASWRLVVLGDDLPSVRSKIEALRARPDRFEVLAE